MRRSCGVLLPIFSLPGPYGIGSLGRPAREFIDFLAAAGQSWWQILPVGPTGYGDSPYQCLSSHAGNPYFIDLEMLGEAGWLTAAERSQARWQGAEDQVDYGALYRERGRLLAQAARRALEENREEVEAFFRREEGWLRSYALFALLKRRYPSSWAQWPRDLRRGQRQALEALEREAAQELREEMCVQYFFFSQWQALRRYAQNHGVGIIGDLPIYVSPECADVWAEPRWFRLDEDLAPREVAGVPPDYFQKEGQLWGNPLYDWDALAADGYGWWIRRVESARRLFDMVRIDHFRGFESYWAVPAGASTAREGRWVKGPGMDLLRVLQGWFPDLRLIAEDLGTLTPEVERLLEESGLPGMRVLEFAFSPGADSAYLPHHHIPRCVCYTGTHDNAPLSAWLAQAPEAERAFARAYLGLHQEEGERQGLLRGGMSSVAALFIAQMQDYLGTGEEGRINTPGTLGGNWQWRLRPGQLTDKLARQMAEMAGRYGRGRPLELTAEGAL